MSAPTTTSTPPAASLPLAASSPAPGPTQGVDRILFVGLCALLVFGPLAFGAVEDWSTFVLQAGAAILLMLWLGKQFFLPPAPVRSNAMLYPMGAFGIWVGVQLAAGFSVYPYNTWTELLKYAAYGMLFFLALQCVHDRSRLKRLAMLLVVFGSVLALFAIVQDLTSNGKLYWLREPRFGGAIYGPYVNRNHYAGLMELLAPLAVALYFTRRKREARSLLLFAALLMGGSIFLSRSRGGLVALAAQGLMLAAFWLRSRTSRGTMARVALVGVAAIGFFLWLDRGQMMERLDQVRLSANQRDGGMRWGVLKDSVRMLSDRPLTGCGLGVFPVIYPAYRTFYSNHFTNQAHNDYLQVLLETGIPGFAAVLCFLFLLYRQGLRHRQHWHADTASTLRLGALVSCTGLLVHSFFDFNLHIPANAVLFFVMCAIAGSGATELRTGPENPDLQAPSRVAQAQVL